MYGNPNRAGWDELCEHAVDDPAGLAGISGNPTYLSSQFHFELKIYQR